MCGIVGVMGNVVLTEKKVFKELLTVDVLRGSHSTGVASIFPHNKTQVLKKAVNSLDFLDFKSLDELLMNTNCLIGHNRYATIGKVNNTNAHPFDFDNVVGVHNGTLRGRAGLLDYKDFDVDSENLYHHMDVNGVDDTYKNLTGAFALVWYDKQHGTLNFLRNAERPLSYCFSDDKKTLFWASESWMLAAILGRNGVKHTDIVITKPHYLYKFQVPDTYQTGVKPLEAPHVRKLTKPAPKVVEKKQSYLPKSGGMSEFSKAYTKAVSRIGEEVVFFVERECQDAFHNHYMLCTAEDDLDVVLRVYCVKHGELWTKMRDSVNYFKGRPKSIREVGNDVYLLVDVRTVEEADYDPLGNVTDEVDDDVTVQGFNKEELTYKSFKEYTQNGCAWCGDTITFGEDCVFIGRKEVICSGCKDKEEVQEYIQYSGAC